MPSLKKNLSGFSQKLWQGLIFWDIVHSILHCKWVRFSSKVKETFLDKTPFQTVVCFGPTRSKSYSILQNAKIADLRNGLVNT